MLEVWKDVKGFEGYFQISNLGNVKSLDRYVEQTNQHGKYKRLIKGKMRIPVESPKGYLMIRLHNQFKAKNFPIHRLVAIHFIPNPKNKPQVNHIDGNKKNNRIDNLEWATNSENQQHALRTGLMRKAKGEKVGISKLTEEQVKWILKHHIPKDPEYSAKALAKKFGITPSAMEAVVNRRTWKHVQI